MAITRNTASEYVERAALSPVHATKLWAWDVLFALGTLVAALLLAIVIHLVVRERLEQPECAVMLAGAVLAGVILLPVGSYLAIRRRAGDVRVLALLAIASVGVVLTALYFFRISFQVVFPFDILIWSESDFVNDIIKFRLGYPIYTAQVANESFVYMPGPQLLTYFLATLAGHPTSIVAYRLVQVGFTVLAALVATLCVRLLLGASSKQQNQVPSYWAVMWFPLLLLVATNPLTNPFVHELHNDALAQLFNVAAYFLLLLYVTTKHKRVLWVMALFPALGFFIKQSLIIWVVFYCCQIALFVRPFSLKRFVLFLAASLGAIGVGVGFCYLLWGEHFIYWVFTVLGSHSVSPLRSFQHLLDVWIYFVLGFVGGFILLRGQNARMLLGPWVIWLLLLASETYTSGIAWMINHIGPGCLIGTIWFTAGLTRVWPLLFRGTVGTWRTPVMMRGVIALSALLLLFGGLLVVRYPLPSMPADAYRYLQEIESQFKGESSEKVLMDAGSWIYLQENVIMQDRAPSIGERGYSETGDFSGILSRLDEKQYCKILVRNFDSPDFWYDHSSWAKSSGIRQALLENYHVTGKIRSVETNGYEEEPGYFFQEITVLVPNGESGCIR